MPYMTAKTTFNYSNPIPFWMRPGVEREYMRLRAIACDRLNPNYEEWNKEYKALHPSEEVDPNDELKDCGGTAYCEFLNSKQRPILDEINKEFATGHVRLYPAKECDIGGIVLGRGNRQISTFNVTLSDIQYLEV